MALLMLLEYLVCNVLLAWATLQQPYISKSLSSPPPQNPNNWVHSVIFEPQPKIQLTCSSYKVTSFLDFQPFLKGFQSVNKYLNNLWTDINDPSYFWHLFIPFGDIMLTNIQSIKSKELQLHKVIQEENIDLCVVTENMVVQQCRR